MLLLATALAGCATPHGSVADGALVSIRGDHAAERPEASRGDDDPLRTADRGPSRPSIEIGLLWENDIFARTDRHYTNGVRVAASFSPPATLADAVARQFGRACDLGVVAAQKIYTPEDLDASTPPAGDRPYAGWLYGGIVLRLRGGGPWDAPTAWPTLDTFELGVGFVGHESLAAKAQRLIHAATGSDEPKGWSTQVSDRLGVQLSWLRQVRVLSTTALPLGLEADLVPHVGAVIGNVTCAAGAGATARLGWGLAGDFGGHEEDALAAALAPLNQPAARSQSFGVWLLGRVDVRAVLVDAILEGRTPFAQGREVVTSEPVVASGEVGVMIALGHRVLLGYTHTYRTPEFRDQRGPTSFGGLFLHVAF